MLKDNIVFSRHKSDYFYNFTKRSDYNYDLISQRAQTPEGKRQKGASGEKQPEYYEYQGKKFLIHRDPKTGEKYIKTFVIDGKRYDIYYNSETKRSYIIRIGVLKTEFLVVSAEESEIVEKQYFYDVDEQEYEVFWDKGWFWQKDSPFPYVFKNGEKVYIDNNSVEPPRKYIFVKGTRFDVYENAEKGSKDNKKAKYVYYLPLGTEGNKPYYLSTEEAKQIRKIFVK